MTTTAATALQARPIGPSDLSRLTELLNAEGLPTDDLRESNVRLFTFHDGDEVVGYAGLEVYATDALLRSVVVDHSRRREGLGRAIVEAALTEAQHVGATRAFLLTTSAKSYFERLGFAAVDRASAPAAILATRQAAGLCPSSAPLMVRALADATELMKLKVRR